MLTAERERPVDFWLTGQFRVRQDGEVRTLGPTVKHEILALLLVHANSAVAVADIAHTVWPNPAQIDEEAVRPYIVHIRRMLSGMDCRLATLTRRYLLEIDPDRIDVLRFNDLLERSDRGDERQRRRLVERALETCPTDELLSGFNRTWVNRARDEHRPRWRTVMLRRNQYWLDSGDHERLLVALRREQAHRSVDQRLAVDYLLALYRSGHVAEAEAHYDKLITHLTAVRHTVQKRLRTVGEAICRQDPTVDGEGGRGAGVAADMLPPPPGGLEGRGAEIRAIDAHAAAGDGIGLVGIYGAPGIGKTTLATVYAHRSRDRYPGGVLFAEMGPGGADLDTVLESFLLALGVAADMVPRERAARLARYRDLIRHRATLVVLDNVTASADAAPLLPTRPGSLAIVTSRRRLTGLTARHGAMAIVLGPIGQAASEALLGRLAGGRPDWTPQAAADLVRVCGGHPLALCLAGARIATTPEEPLVEVANALAEPGRRIVTLDRYAEVGEAVTEVIDWSYRELPDPAARVFRLLGTSPCSTLDLAALARLTDLDGERLQPQLADLVASHLVVPAGPDRYGMLDLIAEYAAGLAAQVDGEAERAAALDRLYAHHLDGTRAAAHALWPLDVAPGPDPYRFMDPAAARTWLDDHRDELVAAARHPAARDRPGHVVELARVLFRYLDRGGFLDQAVALQDEAVDAAGRLGDEAAAARALGRLGAVLVRCGRYGRAESALTEAFDQTVKTADIRGQAEALDALGRLAYRRGAYEDALTYQTDALDRLRLGDPEPGEAGDAGDRIAQARTLTNLGVVHRARGDLEPALRHVEEAREIGDALSVADVAALASVTMAGILRTLGRLDEADRHSRAAINGFRALGDRVGEAAALSHLGLVRSDQGHHGEAIELNEQALRIFTEIGDEHAVVDVSLSLGTCMLRLGRRMAAVNRHLDALARAVRLKDQGQVARAHACLAEDYAEQSSRPGAGAGDALARGRTHAAEALGRFRDLGVRPPAATVELSRRLVLADAA